MLFYRVLRRNSCKNQTVDAAPEIRLILHTLNVQGAGGPCHEIILLSRYVYRIRSLRNPSKTVYIELCLLTRKTYDIEIFTLHAHLPRDVQASHRGRATTAPGLRNVSEPYPRWWIVLGGMHNVGLFARLFAPALTR